MTKYIDAKRKAARHGKLVWRDRPVLARLLYAPHDWMTEVASLDEPERTPDHDRNSRNSEKD